jgi:hypothetical protein
MTEFVPWIADAQAVIKQGLLESGKPRDWMFLIQVLPPEELPFVRLRRW